MRIYRVSDTEFKKYGQILEGYDLDGFLEVMNDNTPMPEDGFIYVASEPKLEQHALFEALRDRAFGGMPVQLGYCNGTNTRLNCLEYHRDSEICIMSFDTILLLGLQSDIVNWEYDTANVEAFLIPGGTGVELFATTLHYAPCSARVGQGYRVANLLAKGTNGDAPAKTDGSGEDRLLMARNKWLLAHRESDEAKKGAHVGLKGSNIDIQDIIR